MTTICVLGDEDTCIGFKLAGVDTAVVVEDEITEQMIETVNSAQLVITTEDVEKKLQEQHKKEKITALTIILPTQEEGEDPIAKILEEAIGIKLKE
tara:strand:+ start:265 stop:552 length:288 start_codon:yes stop_codon:yes gene_type:complete